MLYSVYTHTHTHTGSPAYPSCGTTNLHLDISDATNVMVRGAFSPTHHSTLSSHSHVSPPTLTCSHSHRSHSPIPTTPTPSPLTQVYCSVPAGAAEEEEEMIGETVKRECCQQTYWRLTSNSLRVVSKRVAAWGRRRGEGVVCLLCRALSGISMQLLTRTESDPS